MAGGIATNAILTRLLSPVEIGIYFLIMSIGAVVVLVAQMGLSQLVVRHVAEASGQGRESQIRDMVWKAFISVAVVSSILAVIYAASAPAWGVVLFHSPLMGVGTGLVAGWIVLTALRTLAAECFRGFHAIRLATLFEGLLTSLLFFLMMLWAWRDGHMVSLHRVLSVSLLAALGSAGVALGMLWTRLSRLPYERATSIHALLRAGLPLLVSNLIVVLMTSFGLWAVGFLTTSADAALYGTAARLVVLVQFPLLALNAVVPPMVAHMHARSEMQQLERTLRLLAFLCLLAALAVMLVFTLWGKAILGMLFGSYYAGAYGILLLLGAGIVANAWAGFCGPVLMMTGHQKELMRLSLLASVIMLPVTILSGRFFGAEGVAAGISIGVTILHILMLMAVYKKLHVRTYAAGIKQAREALYAG